MQTLIPRGGGGISSPQEAAERFPNALWCIGSTTHRSAMKDELNSLNIEESRIAMPESIGSFQKAMEEQKNKRLTPQPILSYLNIYIARHCNLNCAGCVTFSPLVEKPKFPDIIDIERDLVRLSKLLDGKVGEIALLGGEPLLNPKICEYIKITRKQFADSHIYVFTNGTLLSKMKEDFWDTCKDNTIEIRVSPYPFLDTKKLTKIAFEHGVELNMHNVATEQKSFNYAFDLTGSQNPVESFSNCKYANNCIALIDGKLATCQPILNMEYFNRAFGTNIEVTPDDYIDIYEVKSGKDILEFLSKPAPMCRYCDVSNRTFDTPWHLSKKEISEWVITT